MRESMLKINNLKKQYGKKLVLDNINLELSKGMIGLLGNNGAGKTTLMKIIATLLEPTQGTCSLNKISIKEKKRIRKMLGYIPQEFSLYPDFTCYEMLDYFMLLDGVKDQEQRMNRIVEVLEMVNLQEKMHVKIKNLSGGMKRRVGVAQALLGNPMIIIADEPSVGLDPEERRNLSDLFKELSREKIVLLSTHIISDIEEVCDTLGIMKDGKLLFYGTKKELKEKTNMQEQTLEEAYLQLINGNDDKCKL